MLLQEQFQGDAWKVLVTSIFLKRTRGTQVKRVIAFFFNLFPTPERFICHSSYITELLIKSLGFSKRRTQELQDVASYLLLHGQPRSRTEVKMIHGVGDYVADAYAIFVLNDLNVNPKDYALRRYVNGYKL